MYPSRGFRVRAALDEHNLHPRASSITWASPFKCCQEAEDLSATAQPNAYLKFLFVLHISVFILNTSATLHLDFIFQSLRDSHIVNSKYVYNIEDKLDCI